MNVDQTATVLQRLKPDVIVNTSSLMSWWVTGTLPETLRRQFEPARSGWRLPMHLAPAYTLMQAAAEARSKAVIVNAAYPDAVNAVLVRATLGTPLGLGNVQNVIPALTLAVADALGTHLDKIRISLVAHHYVSFSLGRTGTPGEAPYHFRAYLEETDITRQLNINDIFSALTTRYRRLSSLPSSELTVSSALRVINNLITDRMDIVHMPGPNGTVGGYPVRLHEGRATFALPDDLPLRVAIKINEDAQRFDGIEQIKPNGDVLFVEEKMAIIKDLLGFGYAMMRPADAAALAGELLGRYDSFIQAHGLEPRLHRSSLHRG